MLAKMVCRISTTKACIGCRKTPQEALFAGHVSAQAAFRAQCSGAKHDLEDVQINPLTMTTHEPQRLTTCAKKVFANSYGLTFGNVDQGSSAYPEEANLHAQNSTPPNPA